MRSRVRYACEWGDVGIGIAAQRAMRAIAGASSVDLAWEPLVDAPHGRERTLWSEDAPAWMRALRRRRVDDEVLVHHAVPGNWKQVAEELSPRYQIGHSVWELDDVPAMWIGEMSDVDEFWVPTQWNREAFARSFSQPVHVVPHVVSDAVTEPIPMAIPDDVAVVSLVSAWDWRKRPDRTIEAFCHAFTSADPVVLAVKSTPYVVQWPGGAVDVSEMIHRITEQFDDPPAVFYDTRSWTDGQMLGLAQRSICSLSLTSSEGWGLGTFDAASVGTPVIITGYGGQVSYLGDDYPGLLPFRRIPTNHPDRSLFELGTEWAHPDLDAAVDLLRAVVDGTARDLIERARELQPVIASNYAPNKVGALMVDLLALAADRSDVRRLDTGTRRHPDPTSTPPTPADPAPRIVLLTPVKNAAHHAVGYVDRVLSLEYPASLLRVAVLVSDSGDGSVEAFRSEFARLGEAGIAGDVYDHDFGYHIPPGVERFAAEVQLQRRLVLAKSRNHLLSRGLGDADWALWIDADVVEFPSDIIERLLSVDADVVHPHCLRADGTTFDLNAWTDRGRFHLDAYRGHASIELDAVGGTMLLVRADRHRDGLTWPAYLHGVGNPRIRTDPALLHRVEIGEVETEGLAILADDMGIACVGLPDLHIRHE